LSITVLVAGLAGGVLISDRQTQHRKTADLTAATAADAPRQAAGNNPPQAAQGTTDQQSTTDQQDAQTKADNAATAAAAQAKAADDATRKNQPASRSDDRTPPSTGPTGGTAGPVPASCQVYSGNRATGCTLMLQAGYGMDQAPCLINLWNRESGWNVSSTNKSSGAFGIPQAVPGTKMAAFGSDWRTNPVTQIKWGLSYIKGRYKSPCGAWSHSQSTGWY